MGKQDAATHKSQWQTTYLPHSTHHLPHAKSFTMRAFFTLTSTSHLHYEDDDKTLFNLIPNCKDLVILIGITTIAQQYKQLSTQFRLINLIVNIQSCKER